MMPAFQVGHFTDLDELLAASQKKARLTEALGQEIEDNLKPLFNTVSDSQAEFLDEHSDFDAASNDANLNALEVLKRSTPSALALTLKMRSEPLHVLLQPTLTPSCLCCT